MRIARSLAAASALIALAAPVMAHTETFTAVLNGASEAPSNSSTGLGTATVIINDHDYTMEVIVSFSSLVGNVTASHIHCCTATAGVSTAGVSTMTPTFLGFPSGVKAGTYDHTFNMLLASSWNAPFLTGVGGLPLDAFNKLLGGMGTGKAYLNIHTQSVPGGEIRGFLQLAPVPEPGSYALMLAGLGLIGWTAKRRQDA